MPQGLQIRQAYWLLELNVVNGACFEHPIKVCSNLSVVLHRLQGLMGVKSRFNLSSISTAFGTKGAHDGYPGCNIR